MPQIGSVEVLLEDDFNTDGKIDSSKWKPNIGPGSFLGATQMRPELPSAHEGVLQLKLDTFNPSGRGAPTFFGSEAISKQTFAMDGSGYAFEGSMRLAQDQKGLIAGFFTFWGDAQRHDEIDFELIPERGPNLIQTNLYVNDTYSGGDWKVHEMDTPLTEFHTFRIEWLPDQVRWFVDGELVRTEDQSPTRPMALHMNLWGPGLDWDTADPSFKPTNDPSQNRSVFFDVDWVKVERLSAEIGTDGSDVMSGSAVNDYLRGGGGADLIAGGEGSDMLGGGGGGDRITGGSGDDEIYGAGGNDTMKGNAGDDLMRGGNGDDLLLGGLGDDRLVGGEGLDVMVGGAGADVMRGGKEGNVFLYQSVDDSPGDGVVDRILDFNPRWGDVIDLAAIDADETTDGDDAFAFIGESAFSGVAGELMIIGSEDSVMVLADTDGDAMADLQIFVGGPPTLYEDAFIL